MTYLQQALDWYAQHQTLPEEQKVQDLIANFFLAQTYLKYSWAQESFILL